MRFFAFLSLFCLILFGSCTQKEDGCTDTSAINFDAIAEIDCCCQLPQIRLRLSHQLDSVTLTEGLIAQDNFGTFYQVNSISLLISDLRIRNTTNPSQADVRSQDQIELTSAIGNPITITDDFARVNSNVLQIDFGQPTAIQESDIFQFTIGSSSQVAQATAPSDHVLNNTNIRDSINTLLALKMELTIDTDNDSIPDSPLQFQLQADTYQTQFQIPFTDGIQAQEHAAIDMTIQYLDLFNGIDLLNDPYTDQIIQLQTNFTTSTTLFSPTP